MLQTEQQPVNVLAPFVTKSAQVGEFQADTITFADGSSMTTAQGGSLPSDVDCGTF